MVNFLTHACIWFLSSVFKIISMWKVSCFQKSFHMNTNRQPSLEALQLQPWFSIRIGQVFTELYPILNQQVFWVPFIKEDLKMRWKLWKATKWPFKLRSCYEYCLRQVKIPCKHFLKNIPLAVKCNFKQYNWAIYCSPVLHINYFIYAVFDGAFISLHCALTGN